MGIDQNRAGDPATDQKLSIENLPAAALDSENPLLYADLPVPRQHAVKISDGRALPLEKVEQIITNLRIGPEMALVLRTGRVTVETIQEVAERDPVEAALRMRALNSWDYKGDFSDAAGDIQYFLDLVRPDRASACGVFVTVEAKDESGDVICSHDIGFYAALKADRPLTMEGIGSYYTETIENLDLIKVCAYLNGAFFQNERAVVTPDSLYQVWDYSTRPQIPSEMGIDPILKEFSESARNKGVGRILWDIGTDSVLAEGETTVGFIFPEPGHMESLFAATYTGSFVGKLWDQPYPDESGNQGFLILSTKLSDLKPEFTGNIIYDKALDRQLENLHEVLAARLDEATRDGKTMVGYNPDTGRLETVIFN